jgi:hypothetical protein
MTPRDLPILLPLIGLLLYGAVIIAAIAGVCAAIYFVGLGLSMDSFGLVKQLQT